MVLYSCVKGIDYLYDKNVDIKISAHYAFLEYLSTGVRKRRRSWHELTTPLFSNFLFTNLFSIKFVYFYIISYYYFMFLFISNLHLITVMKPNIPSIKTTLKKCDQISKRQPVDVNKMNKHT